MTMLGGVAECSVSVESVSGRKRKAREKDEADHDELW